MQQVRFRAWESCALLFTGFALGWLAVAFPFSPWAADDFGSEIIAAACNFGARIADLKNYPTGTMSYHPAVWLYLASGVSSLVTLGAAAVGNDLAYFDRIMDQANEIHEASKFVLIGVTLLSLYLYRVAARSMAPPWVIWSGLAISFLATPQAIFRAVYMTTESFGPLVNVLLVSAVAAIVWRPKNYMTYVLCGSAIAFAYLLKISYIYVYFALSSAIVASAILQREYLRHLTGLAILHATSLFGVMVIGKWFIGRQLFQFLRTYQFDAMKQASTFSVATISSNTQLARSSGSTVALDVLIGVLAVGVGVAIGVWRRKIDAPTIVISVAAMTASIVALSVTLKTYNPYYELAASGTLPLLLIACWRAWQPFALRASLVFPALVATVALALGWMSIGPSIAIFQTLRDNSLQANNDRSIIASRVDLANDRGIFLYHTPFKEHGAGYVAYFCGLSKIQSQLRAADRPAQSSLGPMNLEGIRYVVADKAYVNRQGIVEGRALDPLIREVPRYEAGDQLVELKRSWLIIKAAKGDSVRGEKRTD